MVEVFKTNVSEKEIADMLRLSLERAFPACKINFDLHDCDRILRLEGRGICTKTVTGLLHTEGFECELLED
ncbi:MAG: hypothetical protein QM664_12770 [Flavihumibacter sp.]